MEHVAQHIEGPSREKVVFGGEWDETLVEWASREDVAIIERGEGGVGWVLKSPLKRGPGGCVVVTALGQKTQLQRGMLGEQIVVWRDGNENGEDDDAEGEDDDAEGEKDDAEGGEKEEEDVKGKEEKEKVNPVK